MIRAEDVFRIGRLGKPHGVKGEVTFQVADDVFDRVDADYLVLDIDGIFVPFYMEEYRFRSNEVALVKFCDIDTEGQARELTGCEVFFPHSLADEVPDHVSAGEVVGWTLVEAATGRAIGKVSSIDEATLNILFEVETPDGGELLIPANPDLILSVDKAARTLTMAIPEGLLHPLADEG